MSAVGGEADLREPYVNRAASTVSSRRAMWMFARRELMDALVAMSRESFGGNSEPKANEARTAVTSSRIVSRRDLMPTYGAGK